MSIPKNDLNRRCADYLGTGPPAHMTDYMPDSLTEIIIGHGTRSQPLDPELREIGTLILQDAGEFPHIEDDEIRRYMQRGAALVAEVLQTKE
jgi:hypothetical protein